VERIGRDRLRNVELGLELEERGPGERCRDEPRGEGRDVDRMAREELGDRFDDARSVQRTHLEVNGATFTVRGSLGAFRKTREPRVSFRLREVLKEGVQARGGPAHQHEHGEFPAELCHPSVLDVSIVAFNESSQPVHQTGPVWAERGQHNARPLPGGACSVALKGGSFHIGYASHGNQEKRRAGRSVTLKIDRDHSRFRDIVRGRIRKGLREYISHGELIGKQGKDLVSIPIPQIDVPRFTFGSKNQGGVGQGPGQPGDALGDGEESGQGQAGEGEGDHIIEVDLTLEELADILGQELELPAIEDKGKSRILSRKDRYTGIRRVGPESLKSFKRTYREALRRSIAAGTYDPKSPLIVPQADDKRFRSYRSEEERAANAVIIYMMDVSGSMGDEQKEIVRIESFWIDTWLRRQYDGIESRYIIHDAVAREVDRDTFFKTRESGGTMISSAYRLADEIITRDYPASEWNIYPFHFSDGDNWSTDDTRLCIDLLKNSLLPVSNMFAYGQVHSPYGSGQFIKDLRENLPSEPKLVLSEIQDREAIVGSIKEFLGKGH